MVSASAARRYPVGIQTFSEIREKGYIYVDKTELVWELIRQSKYVFLARPRRFGKSLLTTTLKSYFEGRRDLFAGLKIAEIETEWVTRPVLRLDLSVAKDKVNIEDLRNALFRVLQPYVELYGKEEVERTPGGLLSGAS